MSGINAEMSRASQENFLETALVLSPYSHALINTIDVQAALDLKGVHTVITATQEKRVPSPGKSDMIYFDGVILAHCNEAEWNRFQSEHTNEAILDRIVKIDVPYVLELEQEIKIYENNSLWSR